MESGSIGWPVRLTEASIFEMSGGTVCGDAFSLSDDSRLTLTGGTIQISGWDVGFCFGMTGGGQCHCDDS